MRYEYLKPSRGLIATDLGKIPSAQSRRIRNRRERSASGQVPKYPLEKSLSTRSLRLGPDKEDDDGYLRVDWNQPEIPRPT